MPAPIISAVTISSITDVSAIVSWTTDQNCDQKIDWGTTASYGKNYLYPTAQYPIHTTHSARFVGLEPSTLYHYKLTSKNAALESTSTSDATFTTAASYTTPILPQLSVDTAMPDMTGAVEKTVKASGGDYTTLQAALDYVAVNTGKFYITVDVGMVFTTGVSPHLVANKVDNNWVIVRSSAHASLPVNVRVTPSQSNLMFKLETTSTKAAIYFLRNSHYTRFIGMEVAPAASNTTSVYELVAPDDQTATGLNMGVYENISYQPHHIGFDRCYIHGTNTIQAVSRGITLNIDYGFVINCDITNIQSDNIYAFESKAIGFWQVSGPLKIHNNKLEGSAQFLMSGGTTAWTSALPADVTITNNFMTKRLSWRNGGVGWDGVNHIVKYGLEVKYGQRWLIENNILENGWAEDENGDLLVLRPLLTGQAGSPTETRDITVRWNWFRYTATGWNLSGEDYVGATVIEKMGSHFLLENNLLEDVNRTTWADGGGKGWLQLSARWVTLNHNTIVGNDMGSAMSINNTLNDSEVLVVKNNIITNSSNGFLGNAVGSGTIAFTTYTTSYTLLKNVVVNAGTLTGGDATNNSIPANNTAIGFVNYNNGTGGDYTLAAATTYKNYADDGTDPGVNIATLMTKVAGVISGTSVIICRWDTAPACTS